MSRELNAINGTCNVSFAGAWMGWGFHEDGFASGAHVARMLQSGTEGKGSLDLVGYGKKLEMPRKGALKQGLRACMRAVQWFMERL